MLDKGRILALFLLVFPMRRDTELGRTVHFEGADLNFKGLSEVRDDGRVQRLIHIRLRRRDIVLDAPGNGFPALVYLSEHFVTLVDGVDDDAHRGQIVDLVERLVLLFHLFIDGIKVFGAAEHFALYFALV